VAIRHLYTGPDAKSYIDDLAAPLLVEAATALHAADRSSDTVLPRRVTEYFGARTIQLGRLGPGFDGGRHNVPGDKAILVAFLGPGTVEIETGHGWTHRFVPGDLLLCADFTGEGHCTRLIGAEPATNLYVELEADALDGLVKSAGGST
jgi:hypothetical protein